MQKEKVKKKKTKRYNKLFRSKNVDIKEKGGIKGKCMRLLEGVVACATVSVSKQIRLCARSCHCLYLDAWTKKQVFNVF